MLARRGFASQATQVLQTKTPKGVMSFAEFARLADQGEIETLIVGFTDLTGRTFGKRYDAEFVAKMGAEKFESHACEYLLTVDSDMNILPGFKAASWHTGYGDFTLKPVMSTLRKASWLNRTAHVLCDILHPKTHEPLSHAPRSVLLRQANKAVQAGFTAQCASELEYFLYNNTFRDAHNKGYANLEPAGWVMEDYHILQGTRTEEFHSAFRHHLKASGIPVETTKGEYGCGQHETNVEYSEVMDMADRHVVYKQMGKEIAEQQGKAITFMAKPHTDQSGSSCHIHLSLVNSENRNVFTGTQDFHSIMSTDTFRWFMGGWIKYTPDVMPFFAPTINSYKRYQLSSWAPTRLAWSPDNRTAGFRVVGSGESLRIECRIPGADANPYLAFAGSLAAGLEGIKEKIEPPEAFRGDIYAAQALPAVPPTLKDATDIFKKSSFARRAFGDDVVDHYAHFYGKEVAAYNGAVTDWERKRYFEQI